MSNVTNINLLFKYELEQLFKEKNIQQLLQNRNYDDIHRILYQESEKLNNSYNCSSIMIQNKPNDIPKLNQWYFVSDQNFPSHKSLQQQLQIKLAKEEQDGCRNQQNDLLFDFNNYFKDQYCIRIVKIKDEMCAQKYNILSLKKHYLVYTFENNQQKSGLQINNMQEIHQNLNQQNPSLFQNVQLLPQNINEQQEIKYNNNSNFKNNNIQLKSNTVKKPNFQKYNGTSNFIDLEDEDDPSYLIKNQEYSNKQNNNQNEGVQIQSLKEKNRNNFQSPDTFNVKKQNTDKASPYNNIPNILNNLNYKQIHLNGIADENKNNYGFQNSNLNSSNSNIQDNSFIQRNKSSFISNSLNQKDILFNTDNSINNIQNINMNTRLNNNTSPLQASKKIKKQKNILNDISSKSDQNDNKNNKKISDAQQLHDIQLLNMKDNQIKELKGQINILNQSSKIKKEELAQEKLTQRQQIEQKNQHIKMLEQQINELNKQTIQSSFNLEKFMIEQENKLQEPQIQIKKQIDDIKQQELQNQEISNNIKQQLETCESLKEQTIQDESKIDVLKQQIKEVKNQYQQIQEECEQKCKPEIQKSNKLKQQIKKRDKCIKKLDKDMNRISRLNYIFSRKIQIQKQNITILKLIFRQQIKDVKNCIQIAQNSIKSKIKHTNNQSVQTDFFKDANVQTDEIINDKQITKVNSY